MFMCETYEKIIRELELEGSRTQVKIIIDNKIGAGSQIKHKTLKLSNYIKKTQNRVIQIHDKT